jgi:PleD family two-component response regulator
MHEFPHRNAGGRGHANTSNPMNENLKTTMKNEKKRILVVDDQSRNTRLMKLYLEKHQ